jgi:hypothetical protein
MAAIALTKELYFTTTTLIDWMDIFIRPIIGTIINCMNNKSDYKSLYSRRSDYKSDRTENLMLNYEKSDNKEREHLQRCY